MNVYFELADSIVNHASIPYRGKYFAVYGVNRGTRIPQKYLALTQYSNRVWAEDDTGVRYLKNRFDNANVALIDEKEFFWIKLKSQTV